MGYDLWTEEDKARREYVNASDNYLKLQGKYFPVSTTVDGKQIKVGETPTKALLQEIREAITKLDEAFTNWEKISMKMLGDYQ
ncbi:hypothetical protein ACFLYR_05010 [Chloroflexota bacterium]